MGAFARAALFSIGMTALSGCTFVTSCPNGNGSGTNTNNNAGSGNSGNSSGGSSGTVATGGGIIGDVPTGDWTNVTSNLADKASECGNMAVLASKPDEDALFGGVGLQGFGTPGTEGDWWVTRDGGGTWDALGVDKSSDQVRARPSSLLFDPADPNTFWVSGVYGDFGVYQTTDAGVTFAKLGTIRHNDFITVDFSDPKRQTLLASSHENGHTLYRSSDGGANWEEIGDALPKDTNPCSMPWMVDTQTYLFGCNIFGGGVGGIYRTVDAGQSWAHLDAATGIVTAPLAAKDGSIYWIANNGLLRTTDGGETWELESSVISAIRPIELPDGRIAALAPYVVVSADHGKSWRPVTSEPPFKAEGLAYSAFQKAFFVWHSTCDSKVPADAVMRFDFDYEAD
jgi:photosystem II stability/assembly factor-like uncharacterized protein